MKLRPLSDCIIVKRTPTETKTESGLILAFSEEQKKAQGTVIRVGPGKIMDNGGVRLMGIRPGETVLFGEYSGQAFKFEGEEYLMMRENDIVGIVEN